VFVSRSRNNLWKKANQRSRLRVREMRVDWGDADALRVRVEAAVRFCHEGYRSLLFRKLEPDGSAKIIAERRSPPKGLWTGKLDESA